MSSLLATVSVISMQVAQWIESSVAGMFLALRATSLEHLRRYTGLAAERPATFYSAPSGFAPNLATPFQPVGSPGCPGPLACGFGAVTDSSGPRTIQFGLKIEY